MMRCHMYLAVVAGLVLMAGRVAAADKEATKYVRFQAYATRAYGIVEGDRVRQLDGDPFGPAKPTTTLHKLSEVKLLPPSCPTKILAAIGNYQSHMGGKPAPSEPQFFFKPLSCLRASGETIVIPPGTKIVQPEGELVIVIGKRAKDVPVEQAKQYIFGVTCGNDVSARDWQKADPQWWRAKGSDTFGPCGPFVVSGINYDDLLLTVRVNGEVRQQQRTCDLIHSVAKLVSFASRHVTLEPGDLIFTGTPGKTADIKPGDVVEVELEGVGVLRNPVAVPASGTAP